MAVVPDQRPVSRWSMVTVVIACMFLTILGGCASNTLKATNLPPEFIAPAVTSTKNIHMVGLAKSTMNTDTIDRGDVLEVTIITNSGNEALRAMPVRVDEQGMVRIHQVGMVAVAGLELEDAERAIRSVASQTAYRQPHVTLEMKTRRMNRITMVGGVNEPGVHSLSRGRSNLFEALVESGGLSDDASANVIIRRPGQRTVVPGSPNPRPNRVVSYEAKQASYTTPVTTKPKIRFVNLLQATQDDTEDYYLNDGDVVEVIKRTPRRFQVMGLVNKPDEYKIPSNEDVNFLQGLAKAGGRRTQLADKAYILRQVPGQPEPKRIAVSIREAKSNGVANLRLANGDIITVEETPTTFVMDLLGRFVRVGLSSSLSLF